MIVPMLLKIDLGALGQVKEHCRALLALAKPSCASCAGGREVARTHLGEVRAKLADLARLEAILAKTISRCSGDRAPPCPVLDMLATPAADKSRKSHAAKARELEVNYRREKMLHEIIENNREHHLGMVS